MRAVVQRVSEARVEVAGEVVGRIGLGLLVLLGVGRQDDEAGARALATRIAQPLISLNNLWVGVDFQTFESAKVPGVHVIGDATAAAPGMPKSGFMANNHAKVAADSVIALLTGAPVNRETILTNTCYSFVSDTEAVHVASVHKWDAAQKTVVPVPGAGGVSAARSALEGDYALSWARNIWADTLG